MCPWDVVARERFAQGEKSTGVLIIIAEEGP